MQLCSGAALSDGRQSWKEVWEDLKEPMCARGVTSSGSVALKREFPVPAQP
jgi:hypothetical protein